MMLTKFFIGAALGLAITTGLGADVQPAPQRFQQEVAQHFTEKEGAPAGPVALVDCAANGATRVFAAGQWHELQEGKWQVNAGLKPGSDTQFTFADSKGQPAQAPLPWREVRQVLRAGATNYVACLLYTSPSPRD